MNKNKPISGFSKMSREEKLEVLMKLLEDPEINARVIEGYRHADSGIQQLHDQFSENTISNYVLPWGLAPNFLVNGKMYMVPMVTEESSVVAAAAKSAGFWAANGGFVARVEKMIKNGQVHLIWYGDPQILISEFPKLRELMFEATAQTTANMVRRGGGINSIELVDKTKEMEGYFQVSARFDTRDSMGANFINTCLEEMASVIRNYRFEKDNYGKADVIMSILSNYTDECIVSVNAGCPVDALAAVSGDMQADEFAERFCRAVNIANVDVHRATTHNKGIFNGIDAVVIATGNDFRAIEAAGHAWASRNGRYSSLTRCNNVNGKFEFTIELPMALGTVGGLTRLHPLAGISLDLLGKPDAVELMGIIASVGLASNFAAVSSLVTKGIQAGHMKMHLSNILTMLAATPEERVAITDHFRTRTPGYSAVKDFLEGLRKKGKNFTDQ